MKKHIHMVHHVPGRVRLKVPQAKGNKEISRKIKEMSASIPGVHSVEASPVTGSVVVHYDKNDPEARERLKRAMDGIDTLLSLTVPEVGETQEVLKVVAPDLETLADRYPLTRRLVQSLKASDSKVKEATGGAVDLETVLPLALAAGILMFENHNRPLVIGVLGLLSLHSFAALHGPAAQR